MKPCNVMLAVMTFIACLLASFVGALYGAGVL